MTLLPKMLPSLLLLSTGGTIAGRGAESTRLNSYAAGALSAEELLAAVPELHQLATFQVEAVASVDSADLQFQHWIQLVKRIQILSSILGYTNYSSLMVGSKSMQ